MEGTQLIFAAIIGILVQYLIIYYAVYNSREKERKQLRVQTELLIRMARKAGVEETEIQESVNS